MNKIQPMTVIVRVQNGLYTNSFITTHGGHPVLYVCGDTPIYKMDVSLLCTRGHLDHVVEIAPAKTQDLAFSQGCLHFHS